MIKIHCNYNKQDIYHQFSEGQTFPAIQGKLISVELNGKELNHLLELKEIPINSINSSHLAWYGKHASGILKLLKELFDK